MSARIYKPAKNAMQSGKGKAKKWVLEFDPAKARKIDPLMGYTTSSDMNSQVKLTFDTLEAAKAYAEKNSIEVRVVMPKQMKRRAISYSSNFSTDRALPWTH